MIAQSSALLAGLAGSCLLLGLQGAEPSPTSTRSASATDGWVSLFDGESLDGWTETGGPYDGDADWTVEDGVLVGREAEGARGGLLYTEGTYENFEFECDVKINAPFDSGIFVRMAPDTRGAQFTLDDRPGGEICGIYSDGWIAHQTGGDDAWRSGEWCHVRVRCEGQPMHLVSWIDGKRVLDVTLPADLQGGRPFAPSGRIGVQVHGGMNDPEDAAVRFKNMRVRELPDGAGDCFAAPDAGGAVELTAVGEALGWRSLFNGKDLTGWRPAGGGGALPDAAAFEAAGYRAMNGEIQALMTGTAPFLRTARTDWRDFELRMDFKIAKLANSGVFLRSVDDGSSNPSFNGCEVQILDDFNWEAATGTKLADYQFTGGLYGAVAAKSRAMRPIGEWNSYAIRCVGSRMWCALNGVILWDVDTAALEPKGGAPFPERAPAGFIGMQRHGAAGATDAEVGASFRNLFVREL